MRLSAIILLTALMLGRLTTGLITIAPAEEREGIVTLDVCNSADPALTHGSEMPVVVETYDGFKDTDIVLIMSFHTDDSTFSASMTHPPQDPPPRLQA